MSNNQKVVRIFTAPLQFPCGPQSSCCGPIGQSDDDVKKLSDAIRNLGVEVEVYNIMEDDFAKRFPNVSSLLGSFGPGVVPILAVGDDIVCMGQSDTDDIIQAIKGKL